ncbi:MAG: CPBP family intramembrane metalloprotease [Anaerolineaceae bacterium]|nr:CPBP family intramembrane metalloprotease [Anaerolineaceae bacterium]
MEAVIDQTVSSEKKVDTRRVLIYLAFAFGIAWLAGLVVYLTGGLANSQELFPGTGITWVALLLPVAYMGAPAIAHVLTRVITKEGWKNVGLRLNFRKGWPYWLMAWFGPAVLTIVGIIVYFLIFPQHYDPELGQVKELLARSEAMTGVKSPITPWTLIIIQVAQAALIAPLINGLFTFGEEFGWRAYLQPKLMSLGPRKAMLWMGLIWGVWHWPLTAQGHNYGLEYAGFPWLGMLSMVWMTFGLGLFLGWMTFRAKSVWPAVIGHAAVNGIAALGLLFTKGEPSTLLGPSPAGWIGGVGFVVVALLIFFSPKAFAEEKPVEAAVA